MRCLVLLASLVVTTGSCESTAPSAPQTEASSTSPPTFAKVAAENQASPPANTSATNSAEPDKGSESCDGKDPSDCSGGCNRWDEAANDVLRREVPTNASWTTLAVEGMTCGGCERRIIANVGNLEGVEKVEADAEMNQVRIATASEAQLDVAKDKIRSLGYTVVEN